MDRQSISVPAHNPDRHRQRHAPLLPDGQPGESPLTQPYRRRHAGHDCVQDLGAQLKHKRQNINVGLVLEVGRALPETSLDFSQVSWQKAVLHGITEFPDSS